LAERGNVGFVLLATLLFGAGVGYATELSPFLVCAFAVALIVNASPGGMRCDGCSLTGSR